MLLHSLFEQGVSSNSWQQGIFVSNKHRDRFIRGDGIFLTASLCLVTLVCGEDCTIAKHSLSRHSIPRLGFPAVTAYTDFGRVSDEHRTSIRRASDEVFSLPSQLFLHLPLVRTAVYFTKIKFTPEGRASVVYLPVSDSYRDPKTMSSSLYSSVVYTKSFCTFRFALRAFVNVPFLYSTWKFACTRKRDNLSEFLRAFQFKFCASWSLFQRAY